MSYVGKYVDEIILRNLMTLFPLTFFYASRFQSVKQRNVTEIACRPGGTVLKLVGTSNFNPSTVIKNVPPFNV